MFIALYACAARRKRQKAKEASAPKAKPLWEEDGKVRLCGCVERARGASVFLDLWVLVNGVPANTRACHSYPSPPGSPASRMLSHLSVSKGCFHAFAPWALLRPA
eukprot:365783-Chlamydomonas_euryale.AAC.13